MAKNPETIDPFHEEHHDEEMRLYGNDKKARNYIPVEQLPAHDKEILEQIPAEDTADDGENYYEKKWRKEAGDETRAEEFEKRKEELKKQILEFHESDGVASVYTVPLEEKRVPLWELEKPQKDEFAGVERENIPRKSRRKTNELTTSMSPEKVSKDYDIRKYKKSYKDTASGKDNLKTIPDSKKQRSFRQKIKDFFSMQNNEETPAHKEEAHHNDYVPEEEPEEVILNDKSMDSNLLEQEDRAA